MRRAHIHHVNVMVDDLPAAVAFYRDDLGLEPMSTPDLGFPAQFFRFGENQELHVNELEDRRAERAHFCIQVPDFEAVFWHFRRQDLLETETWGRVRRLPSGVMQMFVRDPGGNLIEISCSADQPIDDALFADELVEDEPGLFIPPDS